MKQELFIDHNIGLNLAYHRLTAKIAATVVDRASIMAPIVRDYAMFTMRCILAVVMGSYTPISSAASVEERLERLEQILLNKGVPSDILTQVQQLQDEVQALRAELNDLTHALEVSSDGQADSADGAKMGAPTPKPSALPKTVEHETVAPTVAAQPDPDNVPLALPPVVNASIEAPAIRRQPPPAPIVRDDPSEAATYQQTLAELKAGRHGKAIKAFRTFIDENPDSSYADNAQYWLGEAYYVSRDFSNAISAFNRLLEAYPESDKVAGGMLKLGLIHQELGQKTEAMAMFARVIEKFPDSTEATRAQEHKDSLQ